jgi:hypothetical protein
MTRGVCDALTVTRGTDNAGGGNAKLDLLRRDAGASSSSGCSCTLLIGGGSLISGELVPSKIAPRLGVRVKVP